MSLSFPKAFLEHLSVTSTQSQLCLSHHRHSKLCRSLSLISVMIPDLCHDPQPLLLIQDLNQQEFSHITVQLNMRGNLDNIFSLSLEDSNYYLL